MGFLVCRNKVGIVLKFTATKPVVPRALTIEDAKLAGISTREELLALFRGWYGLTSYTENQLPKHMYRNWFEVAAKP